MGIGNGSSLANLEGWSHAFLPKSGHFAFLRLVSWLINKECVEWVVVEPSVCFKQAFGDTDFCIGICGSLQKGGAGSNLFLCWNQRRFFCVIFKNGIYPFKLGNTCSLGDLPLEFPDCFALLRQEVPRDQGSCTWQLLMPPGELRNTVLAFTPVNLGSPWIGWNQRSLFCFESLAGDIHINYSQMSVHRLSLMIDCFPRISKMTNTNHYSRHHVQDILNFPCIPRACEKWDCCSTHSHFCYSRARQDQIFAGIKFRRLSASVSSIHHFRS